MRKLAWTSSCLAITPRRVGEQRRASHRGQHVGGGAGGVPLDAVLLRYLRQARQLVLRRRRVDRQAPGGRVDDSESYIGPGEAKLTRTRGF